MGLPNIAQVVKDPSEIRNLFKTFDCFLGDLKLDVLSNERVNYGLTTTDKPVEKGFKITDSSTDKPAVLVIEIVLLDDVYNFTKAGVDSLLNGVLSWQDKKEILYAMKAAKKPLTYISPLEVLEDMVIVELAIDRSAQNVLDNGCVFNVSLKQFSFVSSDISSIDYASIPDSLIKKESTEQKTANKRQEKKDLNKKNTEPVEGKKKSIALSLLQKAGVLQ